MRAARVFAAILSGICVIGIASCRAPTNVIVTVTTDMACADFKGATVSVGDLSTLESVPESTESTSCDTSQRIGSVVLEPSASEDGSIAFRVVGGLGRDVESCVPPSYGAGCIVARRALKYFPHDSLRVNVRLEASCAGIPCGSTETCVGGACYPATIGDPSQCEGTGCGDSVITSGSSAAIDTHPVWRAAMDANYIYWGDRTTGELKRQIKTLDQPVEILNASTTGPNAVANGIFLDGAGEVWWASNDGGIYHCPVTGCGGPPDHLAQLDGHVFDSIVIAGDTAYFTAMEQGTSLGPSGGDLYWCSVSKGCPTLTTPTELVASPGDPFRLAADSTNVYWTWATFSQGDPTNGRVRYRPLSDLTTDQSFVELADKQNDPFGIVLDSSTVYWANYGSGEIRSCPIAGCNDSPTLLAQNQASPISVALDGTTIYWANHVADTGQVMKCEIASCNPTVVADKQDSPRDVIIDDKYVYWSNDGSTHPGLYRQPK